MGKILNSHAIDTVFSFLVCELLFTPIELQAPLVAVKGIANKAFLPKVVSTLQKPGWGVGATLTHTNYDFLEA